MKSDMMTHRLVQVCGAEIAMSSSNMRFNGSSLLEVWPNGFRCQPN